MRCGASCCFGVRLHRVVLVTSRHREVGQGRRPVPWFLFRLEASHQRCRQPQKSHEPLPNHALQRTEAGGSSFLLPLSVLASLCR